MTALEFHALAAQYISNNPVDRLPREMKNIITAFTPDAQKMMFDVHAHCFSRAQAPAVFFHKNWIFELPFGLFWSKSIMNCIGYWKKIFFKKDYRYFEIYNKQWLIQTKAKFSAAEILAQQINLFSQSFEKTPSRKSPHVFIVELMIDLERGKSFYTQWKELSDLRTVGPNDKTIIPFLAVDPRNPNLYADFLAAFTPSNARINHTGHDFLNTAFPFFGIKIHPSLGYLPSDPVLMDIFKVCAAKKIPVTTNCGSAIFRFSGTQATGKYLDEELVEQQFNFDCQGMSASEQETQIANFFNAPDRWIPVLKKFPELKLDLTNLGTVEQWAAFRKASTDTHLRQTLLLMSQYPNVYADISIEFAQKATLDAISTTIENTHLPIEIRDAMRTKIMFGSGYYLTGGNKKFIDALVRLFKHFDNQKATLNQILVHNPMRFLLS